MPLVVLPDPKVLTLSFGMVIHTKGEAKLLSSDVMLQELVSLQAQMLEHCVALCLILGQGHESVGLLKIFTHQVLAGFGVEAL